MYVGIRCMDVCIPALISAGSSFTMGLKELKDIY